MGDLPVVHVVVRVAVDVELNAELAELLDDEEGTRSVLEVVRDEIESNLQSVSYVRNVRTERSSDHGREVLSE